MRILILKNGIWGCMEAKGYWKEITLKKVTPRWDLSWFVKWISSLFLITSMVMTSSFAYLYPMNLIVASVGTLGWFWVGMLWSDRSLIILNIIATLIYWQGIGLWYINSQ